MEFFSKVNTDTFWLKIDQEGFYSFRKKIGQASKRIKLTKNVSCDHKPNKINVHECINLN